MWRWWILGVLILEPAVAAAQDQPSGAGDEAAIRQIEADWGGALAKSDAAAMEPIVATDYKIIAPDGSSETRDQFLGDFRSGTYKITEWTSGNDMEIRVFGDAAVVTGSSTEKSTYNGEDTSGTYRWTDVFLKRDGRWQAVATQVARMGGG